MALATSIADLRTGALEFFIRFDWSHPATWLLATACVVVPLGLGMVLVSIMEERRRSRNTLKGIQELELPPSIHQVDAGVAALRSRDTDFDRTAFERYARDLFTRILDARNRRTALPRAEVSDGFYRRTQVERALEDASGRRWVHPDPIVLETRLVGALADPHFDALHVLFQWTARGAEVEASLPLEAALAAATKGPEQLHSEVCVFLRRPTVHTKRGFHAGDCPNCGAPYEGGEKNLCSYCQAIVNSGSYGWVLAQSVDFAVYRGPWREVTGLDEMACRDPGFCPEVLEDRGALVFWKWIEARTVAEPGILARLAAQRTLGDLHVEREELARAKKRRWAWDLSVAGVDLIAVELDSDERQDVVHVRVRWTGRLCEFHEGAGRPALPPASFATVLTLVRAAGVTTEVRTGLSTDRCHACMAATSEADAPKCDWCGASFEPGKHDFVLLDVQSWESWLALRRDLAADARAVEPYVPSFKFVDERTRLLQTMVEVARADGVVSVAERALLRMCARRWGVPVSRVQQWLDAKGLAPELRMEPGSWVARAFVQALVAMAAIDGRVDRRERALLVRAAGHLKVDAPTDAFIQSIERQVAQSRAESRPQV